MTETFQYELTIQLDHDDTPYRLLGMEGVCTVQIDGKTYLKVDAVALKTLARQAFVDISFYLRTKHLEKLRAELADPEASDNDRFVIYTHLQNAVVASAGQLPTCQDTGTAIVLGKKGQRVLTDFDDAAALSQGIWETYQQRCLRYSQIAPLEMFKEKNTANNLPAQIDLLAETGDEYKFLFIAKGGGSANKAYLYQSTPAVLNERDLENFVRSKLKDIGTSACPPYHLAVVIGGSSAETNLKTVKLASCGYYDALPTTGSSAGRAFRDLEWEKRILKIAQESKIGAQFGGKYFAHDVRVIRMARHAASCPIGIGVSCSADRQVRGKITKEGIFIEQLEFHPERFLPADAPELAPAVKINLNIGMDKVRQVLTKFPVKTRLELTGTLIVARDAAHQELPVQARDEASGARTDAGRRSGGVGHALTVPARRRSAAPGAARRPGRRPRR